jgi:GH24 family phage-related lysozyme (muramidase)
MDGCMTTDVENWIKSYETLRFFPYMDIATPHKMSIGWGRDIDHGISEDEAQLIFTNDLNRAIVDLIKFDWYLIQPLGVKNALIHLTFHLGIEKLLDEFRLVIEFLKKRDYTNASITLLNNPWAITVWDRAKDIAVMIREGL